MTSSVWLTGSRGFVGSSLAEALLKRGCRVTYVTNLNPVPNGGLYIDYGSRESIRAALTVHGTPAALFHLGWGNVYEPESPVHLDRNVSNTTTLLDELYRNGLRKAILVG